MCKTGALLLLNLISADKLREKSTIEREKACLKTTYQIDK